MTPRVRFAPSPTGLLHVGNARTALFNWLYARHHGGTFIVRVEDTDRERYSEAYLRSIEESLRWLGVDWDEGPEVGGPHEPYNQMGRLALYEAAAHKLLRQGDLYRCFCTPLELQEMRERAQRERRKPMYDSRCRELDPADAAARAEAGEPYVLRVRVPEGTLTFDDAIRGPVTWDLKEIDDFICVRSNGTPVYQFTVAVDDAEMQITHVLRGEDHLSNTPKQLVLLRMLEHAPPVYAHLPLLLGESGGKLSKREGATTITDLHNLGYIREAVVNFLATLGWSSKTEDELFTLEELVARFDLDGCGKAAAVFSMKKLDWLNGQWIRRWPVERFRDAIVPELEAAGLVDEAFVRDQGEWLTHFAQVTQERVAKLPEIVDYAVPFFRTVTAYEEKGVRKHFDKADAPTRLAAVEELLRQTEPFSVDALEAAYKARAEEAGWKLAALVHPTRLAVTGATVGAPLFDTLVLLGRERCIQRISAAREYVNTLIAS